MPPSTPAAPPAAEPVTTRYLLFETDEPDGLVYNLIGEQQATSSAQAASLFFAAFPDDRTGYFVAVSENAFKIRHRSAQTKVTPKVEELGAPAYEAPPEPTEPEPDPEPPPVELLSELAAPPPGEHRVAEAGGEDEAPGLRSVS